MASRDITAAALLAVNAAIDAATFLWIARIVTAAAKAVLLNLARPATAAEVARVVGRSADSVRTAFSTCGSIVRTSRRHWSAHLDPMFADVAAAGAELADNVGLIDEQHLASAAAELGWGGTVEAFVHRCGYIRLSGLLALDATPKATAKAAVLHLGGSATVAEVAAETGTNPRRQPLRCGCANRRCAAVLAASGPSTQPPNPNPTTRPTAAAVAGLDLRCRLWRRWGERALTTPASSTRTASPRSQRSTIRPPRRSPACADWCGSKSVSPCLTAPQRWSRPR